jgi:hypothetical protein
MELAGMNSWMFALVIVTFPTVGFSQQSSLPGNPSGTMDSTWLDPLNLTENPAAVATLSSMQCGVFAGRFNDVKGLNFISAAFAMPVKKLAAGLVIHRLGSFGYQQSDVNLVLGKKLGSISLGIVFHSKFISVQSIGGYHTISVGVGVMKTSGQLSFGTSVRGIGLGKSQEIMGGIQHYNVSSQCLFKVSDLVSLGILASKETSNPVSIQPAGYYQAGAINFSMGFDSLANSLFLLVGWRFKTCEVKIMLGYQANLGILNGMEWLYKRSK